MEMAKMETRSRSAPPFTIRDVGLDFFLREDIEVDALYMDPADLSEFVSARIFRTLHPRTMYWIDNDKVLKLYSYMVDVSVIVGNMDLARTKIPVPRVFRYGRSGNCSYILMERIPYPDLDTVLRKLKLDYMPWQITCVVQYIVGELASLGLSHNDLVPRNLLVDATKGHIMSVVDWDSCTSLHAGGDYARQVSELTDEEPYLLPGQQEWWHALLVHAFDRRGEEIILGCSEHEPKRFLQWPLVKSKAADLVSAPVTDPRNQSFSRQRRAEAHRGQVETRDRDVEDLVSSVADVKVNTFSG